MPHFIITNCTPSLFNYLLSFKLVNRTFVVVYPIRSTINLSGTVKYDSSIKNYVHIITIILKMYFESSLAVIIKNNEKNFLS